MTTLRNSYLRNSFLKHGVCAMLLSVCITGTAAAQSLYASNSDASEMSAAERRAYLMEQRRAQETQTQAPASRPQYQAAEPVQPQLQQRVQPQQQYAQASYDPYAQYRAQQQQQPQPQQQPQYQPYPAPQQQPAQQQTDADIYDPYSLSRQNYQAPPRQPQQAAPQQPAPQRAPQQARPQQQAQAKGKPAPLPYAPASSGEYQLGSSDALRITVFGHKDLSGDFAVDGSGYISMPLIQRVYAQGLTTRQLEQTIQSALSPDYLKNPRVAVEVLNYRPFFILGEVANKGRYEFAEGMTVINAIALAGGFTYRANKDKITIKRYASGEEEKVTGTTVVMPGDVITVPERFF